MRQHTSAYVSMRQQHLKKYKYLKNLYVFLPGVYLRVADSGGSVEARLSPLETSMGILLASVDTTLPSCVPSVCRRTTAYRSIRNLCDKDVCRKDTHNPFRLSPHATKLESCANPSAECERYRIKVRNKIDCTCIVLFSPHRWGLEPG